MVSNDLILVKDLFKIVLSDLILVKKKKNFENELKWFNIGERLIQNGQMIWLKWRENVSHERFVVQIFKC